MISNPSSLTCYTYYTLKLYFKITTKSALFMFLKKLFPWHKSIWRRQSKHWLELNIILQYFVQINVEGRDLRGHEESLVIPIKWALIAELLFGTLEHKDLYNSEHVVCIHSEKHRPWSLGILDLKWGSITC